MRPSVRSSVRPRMGFVNESMYTHVYGVQWSPWRVPFDFFLNFSKISIFGCLAAILRSKFYQNLKFSQSRWGNFFGRV